MSRWIDACALEAVPSDRPLGLRVEGVSLVLVRRGDAVAAVADRCPHLAWPLSEGEVRDGRLVCTRHRWSFDLFAPDPEDLPAEARCERYATRVDGGRVLISWGGTSGRSRKVACESGPPGSPPLPT